MGFITAEYRICIVAAFALNGLVTPLSANDNVPVSCGSYTVSKGDSLTAIADRGSEDLTVARIIAANANALRNPDQIQPGLKLVIPCQEVTEVSACDNTGKKKETEMTEVDAGICKAFGDHKNSPDYVAQVIVTFREKVDLDLLKKAGFGVVSEMKNLPVVVGTIRSEGLDLLSASEAVKRIEPDADGMTVLEN